MPDKLVIGLTGPGGSGKGEVRKIILELTGGSFVQLRKIAEDELNARNEPLTNESIRKVSTELRREHGQDVFAQRSVAAIARELEKSDVVIVDSIKSPEEVTLFRRVLPARFVLLAVQASTETRFDRLRVRGRSWDMTTPGELDWRDSVEATWGLGDVKVLADASITNEGTRDQLVAAVKDFLARQGWKPSKSPTRS